MRKTLALAIIACMLGGEASAKDRYIIGKVHVAGMLRVKNFYGPPGYGESPDQDSRNDYYVLVAEGAPTIEDRQAKPQTNSNTTWFQLLVSAANAPKLHNLVDRCIEVYGDLRYPEWGAHNTPLLIDATKIVTLESCD